MANYGEIASKLTSGISGLTGIIGGAMSSAKIADTQRQHFDIDEIGNIGKNGYGSFNQLVAAQNRMSSIMPNLNYDAIRGVSDGEKVGNVLSSTATGALTGLSVGGPWGALAGAVVGLGAGVGGVLAGDANARLEQKRLRNEYLAATHNAQLNLDAAAEDLTDSQFRAGMINSSANGGKIVRQQTMAEFANNVLNKTKSKSYNPNSYVVREMCNGGVRIRIKR